MPQSERSKIIKELLRWLKAKTKGGGATRLECVRWIQLEVTEMGATPQRAMKYVKSCQNAGLITTHGLKFRLTKDGENWLKRKV